MPKKRIIVVVSFLILSSIVSCGKNKDIPPKYSFVSQSFGGAYYYIDKEGNLVSNNGFQVAGDFNDDEIAYVEAVVIDEYGIKEDVYGYIDSSMEFINGKYWKYRDEGDGFETSDNNDGIYMRSTSRDADELVLMDAEMNELVRVENVNAESIYRCDISDNGLIMLSNSEGYEGFINQKGEWEIDPVFWGAEPFDKGYAVARAENGLYGLIDEKGVWTIEPQYNYIYYNGDCQYFRADIDDENNYIYINNHNEPLNENVYHYRESFGRFKEGLCAVYDETTGLFGYINSDSEWVIEPQFINADDFSNEIAEVSMSVNGEKKCGYIDKEGNIIIDCQFEAARKFTSDGLAAVKLDGKWGYIKTDGSWLLEPQFDDAHSFSNGYAAVKLSEGQEIVK